jgi:hypothetical protein
MIGEVIGASGEVFRWGQPLGHWKLGAKNHLNGSSAAMSALTEHTLPRF